MRPREKEGKMNSQRIHRERQHTSREARMSASATFPAVPGHPIADQKSAEFSGDFGAVVGELDRRLAQTS